MHIASTEFHKENSRDKIQSLIDQEIFKKESGEQKILDYLEKPYETIVNKYENCY